MSEAGEDTASCGQRVSPLDNLSLQLRHSTLSLMGDGSRGRTIRVVLNNIERVRICVYVSVCVRVCAWLYVRACACLYMRVQTGKTMAAITKCAQWCRPIFYKRTHITC